MPNVSKVIYDNEVLIDLTSDTVNEGNLMAGATAHSCDGNIITGLVELYEGEKISPAFSVDENETLILVAGTGNEDRIVFGPIAEYYPVEPIIEIPENNEPVDPEEPIDEENNGE